MKRIPFAILLATLVIVLGWPGGAFAAGQASTEVNCSADAVYVFTSPAAAGLDPAADTVIGQFTVKDLFLKSGEYLTISVNSPALVLQNSTVPLSYAVAFNPPSKITAANIGESYNVTVTVDKNAFSSAASGIYAGELQFLVTSHPSGNVVYQGITALGVFKPQPGTAGPTPVPTPTQTRVRLPAAAAAGSQPPVQTIPPQQVPQAAPSTNVTAAPSPTPSGTTIPEQKVPQAAPKTDNTFWIVWIVAAAAGVFLLIFLRYRKRHKHHSSE